MPESTNPLSSFVVPNSDQTHYTPTTGDVRTSYGVGTSFPMQSLPERRRAFDRWLADHSASVRAAALDEAAEVAEKHWASNVGRAHDIAAAIRALKEEKK